MTVSRYIYKYAVMPLMGPVGVDGRPVFFGVQGTGCLYVWCEVSVMDSDGYKRPMYPEPPLSGQREPFRSIALATAEHYRPGGHAA